MKRVVSVWCFLLVLFYSFGYSQEKKNVVIGTMRPFPSVGAELYEDAFRGFKERLRTYGYKEGENVRYIEKMGSEKKDVYEENVKIAEEILNEDVDIVVSFGTNQSVALATVLRKKDIPLVFCQVTDPVGAKIVSSMKRPSGTNITGIQYITPPQVLIKYMRSILPSAETIGYVYNTHLPQDMAYLREMRKVKDKLGFEIKYIDITNGVNVEEFKEKRIDVITGWLGCIGPLEELDKASIPIIVPGVGIKAHVCLAGVGIDNYSVGGQAADMVIRIFKGEKPGEILPEMPNKYRIQINLKKAKELKIRIPVWVEESADIVIR